MSAAPTTADHVLAALPPQKLFIGGNWVDSGSAELLEVRSPSTGKLLANVPHASAKDVDRAVESARRARDAWRLTPPFERAAACHRIADRILAHREQIAAIISLEQGKPYFRANAGIACPGWLLATKNEETTMATLSIDLANLPKRPQ